MARLITPAKALMGDAETRKKFEDQQTVLAAVQQVIFCPVSGVVLDVRKAAYILVTGEDGYRKAMVVDGAVWDANGQNLVTGMAKLGRTVEVTDGRVACA